MSNAPAPAKPSASAVIVRNGADALEVLLLRRNEKIVFHGGAWVFPGGRVDSADHSGAGEPEIDVAKRAAVRETHEETGLRVSAEAMLPFAHWTTPVELPKRFSTWFFVNLLEQPQPVQIDNSEIIDHRWMTPTAALASHAAGDISLPGPTFVTLLGFQNLPNLQAMQTLMRDGEVQHFVPRLVPLDDGRCTLYQEDAGYNDLDLNAPVPRHRLIRRGTDWDYQRNF